MWDFFFGNSAGMFYNILEKCATKNLNFSTSLLHWKWVWLGLFHILNSSVSRVFLEHTTSSIPANSRVEECLKQTLREIFLRIYDTFSLISDDLTHLVGAIYSHTHCGRFSIWYLPLTHNEHDLAMYISVCFPIMFISKPGSPSFTWWIWRLFASRSLEKGWE